MTTAIMQPYLFPYIGYFHLIAACDTFVVYDDVNYIKQGWINRNRILIQGKPNYITFELINSSSFKKINTIELKKDRSKNLKSVEQAYKKAPEFTNIFPMIEEIILYKNDNLSEFITNSLIRLCNYMGLKPKILISSNLEKNNDLTGEEKVIHICENLNSKKYINPIGGLELYSKESFKKTDIDLFFIKSELITYKQFNNEFKPGLSIIDMLMFNSKETVKEFLQKYSLI